MEVYRIYLLAYEKATRGEKSGIEGASLSFCAAVAIACSDVKHGRPPRFGADVLTSVDDMCKEGPSCA